jgi:adenine-specific DNA methylase
MIPKECKRLAEVEFPVAKVSEQAKREKSIRKGHPSTLHLWWARRPLASSRAMLLALLLPDPCDEHCPDAFKEAATEALLAMPGRPSGWDKQLETDKGLRRALLRFIADFSNWDNSGKAGYLETGRALVRAAHPGDEPLVVDPFAGGGSIPLEALRLGCDTFASDLNPVACLILRVLLEDIPRHGPELADKLRLAGSAIKEDAENELAALYPVDPDGATPIAYLWARTVRCEAPNCGAEIPLLRSLWLCKKDNRKWALQVDVERTDGATPRVDLSIFEPKSSAEVGDGSVDHARATCFCCGSVLPPERVRAQLAEQQGGGDVVFGGNESRIGGARMTAVVTLQPGERGRHYRLPTSADYAAVRLAHERTAGLIEEWERGGQQGTPPFPDEPLPPIGTLGFRVQRYGMLQWGDLFTARQKAALVELAQLTASSEAHQQALALALSRVANAACSLSRWDNSRESHQGVYARQALPLVWDFSEGNPLSGATGGYDRALEWIADVAKAWPGSRPGQVQPADASDHPLPDQSADVWFTDPPYYDAVPYADLSDLFMVWLKRGLRDHAVLRDPFDPDNPLSPKESEAVQDETKQANGRAKDRAWFEDTMAEAFAEGRRVLNEDGVGSVVFAHKTTEGWEALLSGMIRGGWTITGSWPIATEMGSRLRARDSAALATSVHLICRPRPEDALVGDWADVLRELPGRVGDWVQRLQREGVRGADLVFACIGPALEIYSRYSRVETPEGQTVGLTEYLERVWEVVGREALEQVLGTAEAQARNGQAGALEEDARLTALFLWTLQSTVEVGGTETQEQGQEKDDTPKEKAKGTNLPFDVARRFAQPLGIHLDEWESRIIETKKGVVRLIPVRERGRQLFGETGADSLADDIEAAATSSSQLSLFPEEAPTVRGRGMRRRGMTVAAVDELDAPLSATTLDRVHAAMLLQASGRSQALRALLRSEQERGPDFLRLANALSALYPRDSDEKRLLDAMLLAAR